MYESKNRTSTLLALSLFLALVNPPGVCQEDRHRFIYNSDGDNMFLYKEPPMSPSDLFPYVDEIAETSVTTFFMSPQIGMNVNFPGAESDILGTNLPPSIAARFDGPVGTQPLSIERVVANLQSLVDAGHDPLGLVIRRAQERGLETFISFRLNEIHSVNEEESILLSQFWRDHPEWRVGKKDDEVRGVYSEILGPRTSPVVGSWFWGALNFAVPEVRARRLAQLRECCTRYPIDGLELDFQRFPIYFPVGQEEANIGTMTEWLRQVRQMTREVGEKRGKPLLLSIRTMARPEQNIAIGLDFGTWVNEGLVDFIVVSHYLRNDFTLPIREYRELLPPSMPLYGSIEVEPDPQTYRRLAAQLWKEGVDGIYLFNFFTCRQNGKEPPFALLTELGNPEAFRTKGN
jgi:hypothetical protein